MNIEYRIMQVIRHKGTKAQRHKGRHEHRALGLTLVELLVAMMVTSIILGAVASLAYAMGNASDGFEDKALKQAQLRAATMRIKELIRNCRLICSLDENNIAIWRGDDNGDGRINLDELVYIGSDAGMDYVQVSEFYADSQDVPLNGVQPFVTGWGNYGCGTYRFTKWIPQCQNVVVTTDVAPPWSRSACISFDLAEAGVVHHYQISASLRSWAGHLLDETGIFIVADDDE